jgi:hypothetical protein
MNTDWLFVTIFIAVLVVALSLNYWVNCKKAKRVLLYWAQMNQIRILDQHLRHVRRGPFTITLRDGLMVFRITAETRPGCILSGWVACNITSLGRSANRAEVKWDDVRGFPVIMDEPASKWTNEP